MCVMPRLHNLYLDSNHKDSLPLDLSVSFTSVPLLVLFSYRLFDALREFLNFVDRMNDKLKECLQVKLHKKGQQVNHDCLKTSEYLFFFNLTYYRNKRNKPRSILRVFLSITVNLLKGPRGEPLFFRKKKNSLISDCSLSDLNR